MRLFKFLIVSTVLMSGHAMAELDVLTHSTFMDEDLEGFVVLKQQSKLIQDAASAASAAYNDSKLVSLKSRPLRNQAGFEGRESLIKEGQEITSFSAKTQRGNVPAGMVSYTEDEKGNARITVAFHGSECVEDFTQVNLDARKVQNPALGIQGSIHRGFHDRYLQSREALFDVIQDRLSSHGKQAKDVEFLVTGHSLGGALAHVAAADLKNNLAETVRLVSFSSPKVVGSTGSKSLENLLGKERIIRVAREKDFVPMVPFNFLGYQHTNGVDVILEPTVNNISLANHSMDTLKADALSADNVAYNVKKSPGFVASIGNKVSSAAYAISGAGYGALSAVGGAVGGTLSKLKFW